MVETYTRKQNEIERVIQKLGFGTMMEVIFAPFQVDIFAPEIKWVIEIDGPVHRKGRDKLRDEYLLANYDIEKVFRVPNDIKEDEFTRRFLKELEEHERRKQPKQD